MKAIILAAGYATRLYPLTINLPKALLKIDNKPIVEFIVNKLEKIKEIDELVIVSNNRFYALFEEWLKKINFSKKTSLINDLTNAEENRLGALGDLDFAIKKSNIDTDILVIAGDNIFDFDLENFIKFSQRNHSINIGIFDIKCVDCAKKFGVVEIDTSNRVTKFVEKPNKPFSTLIGIGIYFLPKFAINFVKAYLAQNNPQDALGHFLEYLLKNKIEILGHKFAGKWFDIGDVEAYEEAQKYFGKERT
ncbi:MAG: nucleotidyltransferase family protein [Candidatus Omnitrophica bacterium]|nr:nucleotidyltransferase family protein [Candidatus Omnitrophota bacterium]